MSAEEMEGCRTTGDDRDEYQTCPTDTHPYEYYDNDYERGDRPALDGDC